MRIGKSPLIAAAIALLAAGWIAAGQFGAGANGAEQAAQRAAREPPPSPVAVRVAELTARLRHDSITVTGRTAASRRVELRAETDGQVSELRARRGDKVSADEIIAQLRLDDRVAKLAEAKALLRQRELEYEAARQLHEKGFRSTTEQAASQARLDAARAVVEQIEIDIKRTTLRAPFDGIVGEGHVELGDYVQEGDVAAMIVDLDPLLVVGSVSERQIGSLETGGSASVTLINGTGLNGTIRFIAPLADPQTRTYRVELEVANPDYRIRDGITAEIRFPLGRSRAHFVSPSVLTLSDAGVVGVKIVDAANIVHFMPVEILADEVEGVWLGGLPETVRVIVVGQEFVVDGQRVTPVPSPTTVPGASS